MTADAEVDLANRNGRLHPSQRGKILDFNFWAAAVLVVAGIAGLVALVVKAVGDVGDANRLNDVTGWTHDFGEVSGKRPAPGQYPYPIYLYTIYERIRFTYLVVNGHSYRLDDADLRNRVQGERTNIVLSTPRTKILINVLPA
ncbi:hypothetical protein [Amycolatopsis sp. NBC_01480]|uniref:hypothetical protein n=1 Tax=Amycolatopsis sp. NBC_01480 TaxID=2903562 RepID=UPI002E29280F|nr:hypothetical protein [Amycolatopsis sp. NBC_01480]